MMLTCLHSNQKAFVLLRVRSKEEPIRAVNNNTITTTKIIHLVGAGLRLRT